jgi:hypothetical protein
VAYRVLITGDRSWPCLELARRVVGRLKARHPDVEIVHGAARGVDTAFHVAAQAAGVPVHAYPAEWDNLDLPGALVLKRADGTPYVANAGPIRNARMVADGADLCLAVHERLKWSKGTKGCAKLALDAGIPVWLISTSEDVPPVKITEEDL